MKISVQLAKHLREVYQGGNWTYSSFKDVLEGIGWQQATTQIASLNTIALLVYHSGYYIERTTRVLQGHPLEGSDKLSFMVPEINNKAQWQALVQKAFDDVERCASLIEKLPDTIWSETFVSEKYGSYYRNFQGMIEHCHYHLGQIAIIKKLLNEGWK
ncbi:MAG: DUF1572 domain-containing protein [Mangrovimonas sp.]|nr:DUF1572 domain-containing protein [Mangrovimonas sp.]